MRRSTQPLHQHVQRLQRSFADLGRDPVRVRVAISSSSSSSKSSSEMTFSNWHRHFATAVRNTTTGSAGTATASGTTSTSRGTSPSLTSSKSERKQSSQQGGKTFSSNLTTAAATSTTNDSTTLLEDFIQSSTYPSRAIKVLETKRQDFDIQEQRELLDMVVRSLNPQLLERATKIPWEDPECRRILIGGWAKLKPEKNDSNEEYQHPIKFHDTKWNGSTIATVSTLPHTGATRAAHLLLQWCQEWRQQERLSQNQQPTSTKNAPNSHNPSNAAPSSEDLSPPPLVTFRSVLSALADQGNYPLAGQVLRMQLQTPGVPPPDRDCFHRVLQACSKANALQPALECLEVMKKLAAAPATLLLNKGTHNVADTHTPTTTINDDDNDTMQPNSSTYKMLLQLHVNSKLVSGHDTYRFFQNIPIPVDTVCYNITLNALAIEGDYDTAWELYQQLQEELSEQQQQQQHQQQLQQKDDTIDYYNENDYHQVDDYNGLTTPQAPSRRSPKRALQTDPIPFRTVLKAFSQADTYDAAVRAEEVLRQVQPMDARAYTTVIAIWCKQRDPFRACQLLEELTTMYISSGDIRLQPDPMCFRTVIGSLSQIEPASEQIASQAQQVLIDMSTIMRYTPNLVTCNAVLKCWAQAGEPERAQDFLEQMQQWGTAPDIVSYNTLLTCYAKLGNADECVMWLQRLIQGMDTPTGPLPAPNTRTFTAVITALSKLGTPQAAEQAEGWLIKMQECHDAFSWDCAANQVTYNAVLQCWARVGDGQRAEYLFRNFQRYGGSENQPNCISYNILIHANENSLEKVECYLEEMAASGIQPNGGTVKAVQRALNQDSTITNKKRKWTELQQRYFVNVAGGKSFPKRKRRDGINLRGR